MATKNRRQTQRLAQRKARTRAEIREAQRAAAKQRPARKQRRLSPVQLIGGLVTVLVVAGIIVFAVVQSNNSSSSNKGGLTDPNALNPAPSLLSVGTRAPTFALKDPLTGKSYSLAAQRGHPVFLEFFAVWCPVCQGEAPIMAQVTKTYVPKGVRVWSILANPYARNYDISNRTDLTLASKGDMSWFASHFNVHHPQLVDPKFQTVNRYGVDQYPGLYVINGKGVITFAAAGHHSYASLATQIDKALRAG